jgi:hypothetical protein
LTPVADTDLVEPGLSAFDKGREAGVERARRVISDWLRGQSDSYLSFDELAEAILVMRISKDG